MKSFDPRRREVHRGDWITWEDMHHAEHEGLVVEVISARWQEQVGAWSYTLSVLGEGKLRTVHAWDPYVLRQHT